MTDTTDTFVVIAHRSGASVFGAAQSPCKDENGKVLYLPELEARDYAARLNQGCQSGNVWYTVEEA